VRGADPRYQGRVGDAEPPALVAAALADQLASAPDSDFSTLVSLLIMGAAYSNLGPVMAAIALPEYASRQLEHRAHAARASTPRPHASAGQLVSDALADGGEHTAIMAALAQRIDELTTGAEHDNAVMRERLEQLAWARLSRCETADAEWREVEAPARPLIAAVELAQRTRGIAPAPDAPALLASVLTDSGAGFGVDPIAAVAAAAPYLQGLLRPPPDTAIFPLTAAGWQDEVTVAMQAYRETLALRGLEHG
jgi:hypothetical protein